MADLGATPGNCFRLHSRIPFSYYCSAERTAAARALAESLGDPAADTLADLEERRKRMQAERNALKKEINNERRKKQRLLAKAKGLTTDDLLGVIGARAAAAAKAKAKAAAKASAG